MSEDTGPEVAEFLKPAAVFAGYPGDESGPQRHLIRYWAHGAGAAKIGWGSKGDHTRCVGLLRAKGLPPKIDIHGMCNNLEKAATGRWSAQHVAAEKGH